MTGKKNSLKQNKVRHLKIKITNLKRVENFKFIGVILNEDSHQIDLQERIKNANRTYFMLQNFLKITSKIKTKEHNNGQNVNMHQKPGCYQREIESK
jgi:hypothetical protein